MNKGSSIVLRNLSFCYEGAESCALQDVSLEIPDGQVTAILGPNGSGKTTLLRLLLGVLRPQQGAISIACGETIAIAGHPQSGFSQQERGRWLGLVPQDEHVPFDYSVLEFVLLGRAPYLGPLEMPGPADHRVALAALEAVGLTHLTRRPVPNLSAGERQLATVARTLAQQPRVLLLDEPTAHLDLSNRGLLLDIMRTLAAGGVTVIFTTHDPNLAAAVAGFAVLMRQGQVIGSGSTVAMLTVDQLSTTYGLPVRLVEVEGRRLIWVP